jgi:hypothetical protein
MGWEIRFFNIIIFGNTKELHAFLDVSIIDDGSRRCEDILYHAYRGKKLIIYYIIYTYTIAN